MNVNVDISTIFRAFLLTLFAGLSTGLGGLIVLRKKEMDQKFLATSLGFSAGVMIYISFMEMLIKAFNTMNELYGEARGGWYAMIAFFGGIAFIAAIDAFIPESTNPHELKGLDYIAEDGESRMEADRAAKIIKRQKRHHINSSRGTGYPPGGDPGANLQRERSAFYRTGILSMFAIGIHNLPEGLASFMAGLADPTLGVSIAVAIAIHNVPEGISVAIPIKHATGSNKKAIGFTFLSGLAEPVGAIIGFMFLGPFINDLMLAIIFALIAGIMVYISLDELLPAAQRLKEHHHNAMIGLVFGMLIMAVTLQLL